MKTEDKSQPIPGRCGARLRKKPGRYCTQYPMKDRKRCRLHGGLTPRGKDSPHFKGGIYSQYLKASLVAKMETLDQRNPLDLLPELGILRGLLASYLDNMKNSKEDNSLSDITVVSELISKVSILVDKIVRIRNDTALTASELKLIGIRMAEITSKYIPDETDRNNFLTEIFTTAIPPTDETGYPYIESGSENESDQ